MADRPAPPEIRAVAEQEKMSERISVFVENLVESGVQKLVSPPELKGRNFFLTCRTIDNPITPDKQINPLRFSDLGRWANGFTDAYIIDLFEEIPPGSNTLVPVGHRDIRVARFSGNDPVKASGNFAVNRQYTKFVKQQFEEPFNQAVKLADSVWGTNGVDVLDSLQNNPKQAIDQDKLRNFFKEKDIPESQSWRRLGFGKLLVGVELELLKQKGVKILESPSVSDELSGIFKKITQSNPALESVSQSLDISKVKPTDYASFVAPFVLEDK